jgi:hypothetical protein
MMHLIYYIKLNIHKSYIYSENDYYNNNNNNNNNNKFTKTLF